LRLKKCEEATIIEEEAGTEPGKLRSTCIQTILPFSLFRIDGAFMESGLIIPKPLLM